MSNSYFCQQCPTCGRCLQIRVEYLGRSVTCQHCRRQLVASDPSNHPAECAPPTDSLLTRADELLESMDRQQVEQRAPHPR